MHQVGGLLVVSNMDPVDSELPPPERVASPQPQALGALGAKDIMQGESPWLGGREGGGMGGMTLGGRMTHQTARNMGARVRWISPVARRCH